MNYVVRICDPDWNTFGFTIGGWPSDAYPSPVVKLFHYQQKISVEENNNTPSWPNTYGPDALMCCELLYWDHWGMATSTL